MAAPNDLMAEDGRPRALIAAATASGLLPSPLTTTIWSSAKWLFFSFVTAPFAF